MEPTVLNRERNAADPRLRAKLDTNVLINLFECWPDMEYNILDCSQILLPFCFLGHFSLYVFNMNTRSIYIMDSMPLPSWDLSGFLVINFMHSWNGKRLPCISTTSSVLRTKFLVELMKYQENECNDNISEEIQKIIKRISV
ncbi:hypothetical protein ZEAMMB73_Zm00001d038255 [Zea mays]|uniref:Ubiquitin-like protease family profile domain-containing protein n=1 Tax=Zea mays TaxID=4577 RepID=A0A1D6M4T7_MAIZE|nr:hypothetical protein ZEAMMB73_Zm00001d038255 [Zea mays]